MDLNSYISLGTVASNHGNIYNYLLVLVLGGYGVLHAEVNGMEYGVEGITGTGTGTGMERAVRNGKNGKGSRYREGPEQVGRAAEEEDEKVYVGRGCTGVLGGLHGGGIR